MDRREFLKCAGMTTLDVVLSTTILSSIGCDSKANYSGYNPGSDEAKLIDKVREALKREPPYFRHDIDNKKSKHLLVLQDNYIVELHPPGTRIDDFRIFNSKDKLGIVYYTCSDECEALKKLSERINRPDVAPFPQYYLNMVLFVEDVQGKDWELVDFKYDSERALNATAKDIFNKLRSKK